MVSSLLFTTRDPDSLSRIAKWLDEGNVPEVEVHDFYGWVFGSLEDVDYSRPGIVIVDLEGAPLPSFIAEEVDRLIRRENLAVFCKNIANPESFDEKQFADCSRTLRGLLPKRARASRFCAELGISIKKVPGFAEAIGVA